MTSIIEMLPEKLEVSDSVFHQFDSCEQKFFLGKVLGVNGHTDELANAPAQIGTALHVGYQDYIVHGDEDKAVWEYSRRYPFDLIPGQEDRRSFEAALAVLLKLIREPKYTSAPVAQIEKPDGEIVPAIELYFRVRIKNFYLGPDKTCPVYFRGLIDIVRHFPQMFAVEDLKTYTGYVNDPVAKYSFSTQTTGYGFIFNEFMNAIGQNRSHTFEANYIVAKIDIANPQISYHEFTRGPKDIKNWAFWLAHNLKTMKNRVHNNWFFQNSHSCFAYNKRCQFFDVCNDEYDYLFKLKELENQDDERYGGSNASPAIEFELDLGFT